MKAIFEDLGAMRLALLAVVAITAPMAALVNVDPIGLGVITAYVAPAIAVLLVFVLLLDALMSRVFAIDSEGDARRVAGRRIRVNLLAVAVILGAWGPFYYSLLSP